MGGGCLIASRWRPPCHLLVGYNGPGGWEAGFRKGAGRTLPLTTHHGWGWLPCTVPWVWESPRETGPQWGWVMLSRGRTLRRWQCCLLYWRGCTHNPLIPTTTQDQGLQSLPIGALWVAPACPPRSHFALIWAGAWDPAISSQERPQGLTPPSPTLPQPTLASVSPAV